MNQAVIHWEAVEAVLDAAVRKAEQLDIRINVAVVDSGGTLAGFLRMPGAFLHSIDIAIDKAYTAAGFGMSTADLADGLEREPGRVRAGLLQRRRVAAFGGGLPVFIEGQLAGAVGVSGGSEEQDELCARAGLDALDQ